MIYVINLTLLNRKILGGRRITLVWLLYARNDTYEHLSYHKGKKLFVRSKCGLIYYSHTWQIMTSVTACTQMGHRNLKCFILLWSRLNVTRLANHSQRKGSLIEHLKIHTPVKEFKYGQCSNKFTQKRHFIKHLNIHTGEREFKCDHCNKVLKWENFSTHQNTHTGDWN